MRVVTTVFATILAMAAFGQRSLPQYQVSLLRKPQVRADLSMTPQQTKQALEALDAAVQEFTRLAKPGKPPSAYAGALALRQKAAAGLSEAQRGRLRQLSLQFYGPTALLDPSIARHVGLSASGLKKVKAALDRASQTFNPGSPSVSARAPTVEDAVRYRTHIDAAAAKALTAKQRAAWKSLQGRPISMRILLATPVD